MAVAIVARGVIFCYLLLWVVAIELNITGTLPSDKVAHVCLKTNLTARHSMSNSWNEHELLVIVLFR